ncbi:hypothetical protein [Methanococcus voltae]|uniref:Uncharacterized protein n=1 Tax=Methanococcus voltae (strain ATCC BAA-1334 / A3) TaxID=456320 RepID=D7DU29_METV3|nr:hypothetical protein [Methanococcus voltae]MCS3900439.1 putative amidophosphoribosyltransferase [Methanococcus voltae]
MIVWNLICPKCKKRLRFEVDVCPCMASEVELPKCEVCGEKYTFELSNTRFKIKK